MKIITIFYIKFFQIGIKNNNIINYVIKYRYFLFCFISLKEKFFSASILGDFKKSKLIL